MAVLVSLPTYAAPEHRVLYGFTAFPYDLSAHAVKTVHDIILPNSNLYAIHGLGGSDCLPWREALTDRPFPKWLQREWHDIKRRIPAGHVVYVAVSPLSIELELQAACGGEGEEEHAPAAWFPTGARLDHPDVVRAYLNYVRRAVEFFQPRYIVIGIEISELSLRYPARWPQFETLFMRTHAALKAHYPGVQIGAELVLQSLLLPRVATQVKPVVEKSDYLGLSFYPYGSRLGVLFGAPPLPEGVEQWRTPLNWVRRYTRKPIALSETGYITQDLHLAKFGLRFTGSDALQEAFVRDLLHFAHRDRYVFVVWFVPVDYDRLYAKLPPGSEWKSMWMHAGLFDRDLKPKPAWSAWREFARPPAPLTQLQPPPKLPAPSRPRSSTTRQIRLGFDDKRDLFHCDRSRVDLGESSAEGGRPSMRWHFQYRNDWIWCLREIPKGFLAAMGQVAVRLRSDREGPIVVRLEEVDGESHYTVIWAEQNWRQETRPLADFNRDPTSKGDGRVDPGHVVRIVLADGNGLDHAARGERTVWFSDLVFE